MDPFENDPIRQPYEIEFDPSFLRDFTEDQLEMYGLNRWENNDFMREVEKPSSSNTIASGSGSSNTFEPMDHTTLAPSAFDPSKFTSAFVTPRFITGAGGVAGPAVVEPTSSQSSSFNLDPKPLFKTTTTSSSTTTSTINTTTTTQSIPYYPTPLRPSRFAPVAPHPDPNESPVYDLYGSSVVSVHPTAAPSPFPFGSTPSPYPSPQLPTPLAEIPYDPVTLGLPLPPNKALGDTNWKGLYSGSGFDLLGVLARVAARPYPVINIGPVDTGCSFLVCDARKFDQPIVYASETFEKMCGYPSHEILGRNCRFLQSPHENIIQGAPRQFTDSAAAWHLKSHIVSGKESQTSLINYKKDGTPFINLVTIIPITWDSDEIAYFIGLQIDLVEQPSAILARMRNGTFCVNYSLLEGAHTMENQLDNQEEESWKMDTEEAFEEVSLGEKTTAPVDMEVDSEAARKLLDSVMGFGGVPALEMGGKKVFNQLMFDQSNDLVHVISLKGTLLYVSPSSRRILEYDPSELTGQALSAFCHASDIVNVLRDLKDLASGTNRVVTLLYRIRRKNSGYIWLESTGKLLIQPGKGRKCVILIGRPREVHQMSRKALVTCGGFGDQEYWSKLSIDGKHLYSTPHVQNLLGFTPSEMLGKSIDTSGMVATATRNLFDSQSVDPVSVRHFVESETGLLDVVTHLYPNKLATLSNTPADHSSQFSVIAQTNLYTSEVKKQGMIVTPPPIVASTPSSSSSSTLLQPSSSTSTSTPVASTSIGAGTGTGTLEPELPTAYLSTFKALNFVRPDNLFAEMEVTNGTSIHFELQQLRLTNKKLREEKEFLASKRQQRSRQVVNTEVTPSLRTTL